MTGTIFSRNYVIYKYVSLFFLGYFVASFAYTVYNHTLHCSKSTLSTDALWYSNMATEKSIIFLWQAQRFPTQPCLMGTISEEVVLRTWPGAAGRLRNGNHFRTSKYVAIYFHLPSGYD